MAQVPHKVLGVVFLCLLLGGVWLTYGVFTKSFTRYDEVTLKTATTGLNLPARADVKVKGVLVGEVLEATADTDGATLTLGIYPDRLRGIPANVSGLLLPKTLFGEKYVSLVTPDGGARGQLAAGAVIDRAEVAIEVEKVLNDLYPLLRAVSPADVNYTLTAIATALEGRGEALGENLETLDGYLKRLNPQIPGIVADLRLSTDVADLYTDVMPEIATILRNTIKTTGTLQDREAKLKTLFQDVSAFSHTTRTFLRENDANLIRLGELSAAQLRVLAKYAPEYPCLLGGIVRAGAGQAEAFRDFTLHIVLETLPHQPRGYGPDDAPRFGETRGPTCLSLPDSPYSQENPVLSQPDFDDGVDSPTGKGISRPAPGFQAYGDGAGPDLVGSLSEAGLLKSLLAPAMGLDPDQVDDLGVLMVAPMARGAEVTLR